MRLFPALIANLLLILAAVGLGRLLRPLLPQNFLKVDRVAAILLGGLGLLGTLLFLVGMLHFSSTVIVAVLVQAALFGVMFLRQETRELANHSPLENIPLLPAAVIALILIVTLVGGLAEPVGDIKMDAIAYHFLGPRVWLRDAAIHVLPDECIASFPATVETLYAALMAIGGTRAPELFAFVSIGVLLLVSYGFALRLGLDATGAWWAVALIAAMPVVYRGAYGGFVDAIFSGFLLLSLRLALDAEGSREYVLAGIFAGLAMGTKYTGLPAFVLILLAAVALTWVRQLAIPAKLLGQFLLLVATAILVASPWYLRNWVALGSPIYPPPPILLRFFHIKYMSPQAIDALAAIVRKEGLGMGHSLSSFLLLPFNFTFHPANFLNGPGGVGVSLLALAPFGILSRLRDPFVVALGLFSFMEVLGWFVTEQEARFLIHVYILLAIFAVWGWRYVAAKAPRFGPLLSGLAIACSILYGLLMIVSSRVDDLHAAISPNFERQRISREVPFLESITYLNSDPSVKKILVLAPRFPTFYLQKSYLKPLGRFGEESFPGVRDITADPRCLVVIGITHVLDVRVDDNDFRISNRPGNLALVFEREGQRIYRFRPCQPE
jgi:hypothetical protein